jgi:hypothetical protein
VWSLKEYARKVHGISTAVQLQALIESRLGVIVTVQTLRTLLRSEQHAPRREMIQTLCDAFNCGSDAFHDFAPDKARSERWAKDRSEGRKPMPLYPVKADDPIDGIVIVPDESIEVNNSDKAKSLLATFTDPRTLYKDKMKSEEKSN